MAKQQEHTADVVVIGAGPGGYVAAIRAAQLGLKVICVESRKTLGGTCLNVGCIPSKALLESSHRWHDLIHHSQDHGIELGKARFDLATMMKRKNHIVAQNTSGIEYLFKKHSITSLCGLGSLTEDPHVVEVSDEGSGTGHRIQSRYIILATGSQPIELPSAVFDHQVVCDSTDALSWEQIPKKLAVIGGGVIGLELGSVWGRLGAEVEVIEATDRLLSGMDVAFSRYMLKKLKAQGVKVHLSTTLKSVESKNNQAYLTLEGKKESLQLAADKVLVSVGRKPYTQGLGLSRVGLKVDDRGRIMTSQNSTQIPHIFAIGDVTAGFMLAHKAEEEGLYVAEVIGGLSPACMNEDTIAQVVYTWPELASVGASQEQLEAKKIPYKSGLFSLKGNARAKVVGDDSGWVKMYSHQDTDQLLGVHIAAPNASELIAEASVAMAFSASAEDLARTCHAHPTLSEALRESALAVEGRSLHS